MVSADVLRTANTLYFIFWKIEDDRNSILGDVAVYSRHVLCRCSNHGEDFLFASKVRLYFV